MHPRPLLRLQALLLLALTGVLASGLPSHHHERPDVGPSVVDGGHHGHGAQLVELSDRQTSELVAAALPATGVVDVGEDERTLPVALVPAPQPVARGRPPPSDLPRAPPVSV
jgi:hypothetical protein